MNEHDSFYLGVVISPRKSVVIDPSYLHTCSKYSSRPDCWMYVHRPTSTDYIKISIQNSGARVMTDSEFQYHSISIEGILSIVH